MNVFDQLVSLAMETNESVIPLRPVVEKELLHHDIMREMSNAGLLKSLIFMGGTCLRSCYGARRLSEDLDFTGGSGFVKEDLLEMSSMVCKKLEKKYELPVTVTEPKREDGNTKTWKIKIETRPERVDLPAQRINIDITAIPSYTKVPRTLINHYGIEMGTAGLIIQCESREEILLDKMIALALRPNRIKNRDLWDIAWLNQVGVQLELEFIQDKLRDYDCSREQFVMLLESKVEALSDSSDVLKTAFENEMKRFLPSDLLERTINQSEFWKYVVTQSLEHSKSIIDYFSAKKPNKFKM